MGRVKIGYWGSPKGSALFLKKLLQTPYIEVSFVITQPSKYVSTRRKKVLQPSPVEEVAKEFSIPLFTPSSLKEEKEELKKKLSSYPIDFHVVYAYGKIIPEEIFSFPPLGGVNFHFSLLPRWRGASPVVYALLYGDKKTGITLQKLAPSLDEGDILWQKEIPIEITDTRETLEKKLLEILLQEGASTLLAYKEGKLIPKKQDPREATYAPRIKRELGRISWNSSAEKIYNQFRALYPTPGIFTTFRGKEVKIEIPLEIPPDKYPPSLDRKPGEICKLEDFLWISSLDRLLPLSSLTFPGKKKLTPQEFFHGYRVKIGEFFT